MPQKKRIVPLEEVKEEFTKRGYEVLENEDIKGTSYKIKYICNSHPQKIQSITWSNFSMGKGCKECGKEKISAKLSIPFQKAKKIFEDCGFVLISQFDTVHYTEKVKVVCEKHPDVIQFASLRKAKENGCSFCNGKRPYAPDIKEKAKTMGCIWMDYRSDITMRSLLQFKCLKHNFIFTTTPFNLKYRKVSLCPKCEKETPHSGNFIYTLDKAKELFKNRGYILLEEEYVNSHHKMSYWCPKHGVQKISLEKLLRGQRCPRCADSQGEKDIYAILMANDIFFIPQKTFEKCKKEKCLPFDFYIPDFNLCIEYQGIQHYEPVAFRQKKTDENKEKAQQKFIAQKEKDEIKRTFCRKNNIDLLEICYKNKENLFEILQTYFKQKYNYVLKENKS